MMRAPAFWDRGGALPLLLSPASVLVARATARRVARPGWTAPVPVICCGAATVGGAGKTTLVIDLARRLAERGVAVQILLRGYGGSARGVRRVRPDDDAATVGDEALLLAAEAPTWTGADRADSARAAIADGAQALLMDDGLQNPTLRKSFSILVVDGASGFGNGRVLPAGPLREPAAVAAARCEAAVVIGDGEVGVALPTLRARLVASSDLAAGERVVAFAGIGRPEKFFASVGALGLVPVAARAFPDHHRYTDRDLARLQAEASASGAALVTTAKDAARLPHELREAVRVIGVRLAWDDPAAPDALLAQALRSG
jgi:tetraacyldisaccharide 4'-kinase